MARQEAPQALTQTVGEIHRPPRSEEHDPPAAHHGKLLLMSLTALGIVFGDIGTSPLYALQVTLQAAAPGGGIAPAATIEGIVSLIFWALTLIIAVKYVAIVLNADNEGEGGILALASMVVPEKAGRHALPALLVLGILGAALLYGDGVITPAISVLSAVEGIKVAAPDFAAWVIPTTLGILVGLFLIQSRGTEVIGRLFGPVMAVWFVVIAVLGVRGILAAPEILAAFNPVAGFTFLAADPIIAFAVFGALFLALTGGEALYADMGHVGRQPIRFAWFALVYPALTLCYFGQGGLLIAHPDAADNPFYRLVPVPVLPAMIGLAAAATVIASQALISGVFSMTRQAISMRLSPRMVVVPTSRHAYGQIYIGVVNWALMLATLAVVLTFKTSDNLAAAYGIAVSATMLITTILLYRVTIDRWQWPHIIALPVIGVFALIDATFLAANSLKIVEGGWLPLAIGGFVAYMMIAWRLGNRAVLDQIMRLSMPLDKFIAGLDTQLVARLPGTAAFVTRFADTVSPVLVHHVEHNRVLHKHVLLVSVVPTRRPRVPADERVEIVKIGPDIWRVVIRLGFMQRPDIPAAIRSCVHRGLAFCRDDIHYYVAHEGIERRSKGSALPVAIWLAFNAMHRMSMRAPDYFHLPPKRVVEVGFRLEL